MAVPIIENWSRIRGIVQAVGSAPGYPEFAAVLVQVESVQAVADFANLLADVAGQTVPVLVPSDLVERLGVQVGGRISARVRRAGLSRIFVHSQEIGMEPQ